MHLPMRILACDSMRACLRVRAMTSIPKKENVRDYPRPPALEPTTRHLKVMLDGHVIADTKQAYRVLETHHPPTYYLPPEDCKTEAIREAPGGQTMCEWKGKAIYYDVVSPGTGNTVSRRVWAYKTPTQRFLPIAGYYSFYASPFECYVDGERVEPQPGDFYGGWKTSDIEGPIKGSPGTMFW
jgi:uncharacterized protein (DUF427 family)